MCLIPRKNAGSEYSPYGATTTETILQHRAGLLNRIPVEVYFRLPREGKRKKTGWLVEQQFSISSLHFMQSQLVGVSKFPKAHCMQESPRVLSKSWWQRNSATGPPFRKGDKGFCKGTAYCERW